MFRKKAPEYFLSNETLSMNESMSLQLPLYAAILLCDLVLNLECIPGFLVAPDVAPYFHRGSLLSVMIFVVAIFKPPTHAGWRIWFINMAMPQSSIDRFYEMLVIFVAAKSFVETATARCCAHHEVIFGAFSGISDSPRCSSDSLVSNSYDNQGANEENVDEY